MFNIEIFISYPIGILDKPQVLHFVKIPKKILVQKIFCFFGYCGIFNIFTEPTQFLPVLAKEPEPLSKTVCML